MPALRVKLVLIGVFACIVDSWNGVTVLDVDPPLGLLHSNGQLTQHDTERFGESENVKEDKHGVSDSAGRKVRRQFIRVEGSSIRRSGNDRLPISVAAIGARSAKDVKDSADLSVEHEIASMQELVSSIPDGDDAFCARLERGLSSLQTAALVGRSRILSRVIAAIGLQPVGNNETQRRIYGDVNEANVLTARSLDPAQSVGLMTLPDELSCLLLKAQHWNVSTVLDVGTGSGWTCAVIASFLSDGGIGEGRFSEMHTMDTTDRRLDCVVELHSALSIRFHERDASLVGSLEGVPYRIDLCILDAEATAASVNTAFDDLRNRCRYFVFHGVANPGSPSKFKDFWQHLKARMPEHVEECVMPRRGGSSGHPFAALGYGIYRVA